MIVMFIFLSRATWELGSCKLQVASFQLPVARCKRQRQTSNDIARGAEASTSNNTTNNNHNNNNKQFHKMLHVPGHKSNQLRWRLQHHQTASSGQSLKSITKSHDNNSKAAGEAAGAAEAGYWFPACLDKSKRPVKSYFQIDLDLSAVALGQKVKIIIK